MHRTCSRLSLVFGLLLSLPATAIAQVEFSANNFNPAVAPLNYYVTEGGQTIPHLTPTATLYLHYAHRPLRLISQVDDNFDHGLVNYRVGMDLLLGLGLFDRFEVGLALPLTLAQGTDGLDALQRPAGTDLSGGIGDIRLIPKARILTKKRITLAMAAPLFIPSGSGENLLGNDGASFAPTLIGSFDHERFGVALNFGYHFRNQTLFKAFDAPETTQQVSIDDAVLLSLGARVRVWRKLEVIGDMFFAFSTDQTDKEEIPGELITGVRYHFPYNLIANFGIGAGLTEGVGTPTFRIISGVAYTHEKKEEPVKAPPPDPDPDRDGILNPDDACPLIPEDFDGFEDKDGCPEEDNDKDGILDKDDKCPNEPEDKDGFEDEDGCPDPDNDKDGILDANDKCPLKPEDKDGFEDQDGCPDLDNDNDGILDKDDKCPNEPEVFNGVDDEDGCPDQGKGPVNVQHGKITTPPVYFATAKDKVLKRSMPTLKQVAEVLQKNLWVKKIRVEGHTDSRGKDDYNMDLSQRRAGSVMQHLVSFGVDASRLESEGFGETRPIADNKRARGRAKNRRVDFVIIDPPTSSTPASAPAPGIP